MRKRASLAIISDRIADETNGKVTLIQAKGHFRLRYTCGDRTEDKIVAVPALRFIEPDDWVSRASDLCEIVEDEAQRGALGALDVTSRLDAESRPCR